MRREDWTLLAISFARDALSPVQLQKSLFLLGINLPEEVGPGFYEFIPHYYGPFSQLIHHDVALLETQRFIVADKSGRFTRYSITPGGMRRAEEVKPTVPERALRYLRDTVAWTQKLSFSSLIRSIYSRYPEFRTNSVFQE